MQVTAMSRREETPSGRVNQNDRDIRRKYVHGAANPRIEDGQSTEQKSHIAILSVKVRRWKSSFWHSRQHADGCIWLASSASVGLDGTTVKLLVIKVSRAVIPSNTKVMWQLWSCFCYTIWLKSDYFCRIWIKRHVNYEPGIRPTTEWKYVFKVQKVSS